jgi:very-short-patch-repair endonuclease
MLKCSKCERVLKNTGAYSIHIRNCKLNKKLIKDIINDYVCNELSVQDLIKKYNISKTQFLPYIKLRNPSESATLAHKNKPESFKHSEKSKQLIRERRLEWMKNNPEKTAWRKSNMSYPEKIFKEKLEKLGLYKKYLIIRERSVFPYFIDFAFENEKVAVEIDGSQHLLEEKRISDDKRDKYLKKNGWKVYRVSASQMLNNRDFVINDIIRFVGDSKNFKKCGLYIGKTIKEINNLEESNRKKLERLNNNGLTDMEVKRAFSQRIVIRPPYNQLLKEISDTNYSAVGRKYGVSDNSIRKWIKMYEKISI